MNNFIRIKINNDIKTFYNDFIKVIVTGDFCPINSIEALSEQGKINTIYGDFLEVLHDKDISITNLECPITNAKDKLIKTGPNLKAKQSSINILKAGGFDIACLANNHILDYNEKGLQDTIRLLKKNNIKHVGAGKNIYEASQPLLIKIKETQIAILNYAEHEFSIVVKNRGGANPLDLIKIYNDIIEVKKETSIIIVIIHGGIEGFNFPSPEFKRKIHFIASLGPSAIICHHPHIYSGYEVINSIPVFYSLGNFIFDYPKMNKNEFWKKGFLVKLFIEKNGIVNSFDIVPFKQCFNNEGFIGLKSFNEKEFKDFKFNIYYLNKDISNDELLVKKFEDLVSKVGVDRLAGMLMPNKLFRKLFRINFLYQIFMMFFKHVSIYGIINCESHREILLKYLETKFRV